MGLKDGVIVRLVLEWPTKHLGVARIEEEPDMASSFGCRLRFTCLPNWLTPAGQVGRPWPLIRHAAAAGSRRRESAIRKLGSHLTQPHTPYCSAML